MAAGGDVVGVAPVIDFYASLSHYADHLAPIHAALDELGLAGGFYSQFGVGWGPEPARTFWRDDRLTVVASWQDVAHLTRHRRLVYVEHGAGQTYVDRPAHEAYSGGGAGHPARVVGYVAPSELVAARWCAARPGVPVVAVGCPRLDRWLGPAVPRGTRGRVIALAFHWPNPLSQESGSALRFYEDALAGLCARWSAAGWMVLGHGHPRILAHLEPVWRRCGVESVPESAVVLGAAGVLVADNTSLMYEAAALDVPVVALNSPLWRRDVEHGLRFWSHVPGWQIDTSDELAALDLDSYVEADPSAGLRRAAAGFVYAHADGSSSRRAAEFLIQLERGA